MPYFNVIKLDAIDSTNEELKRRHHAGTASSGDLVWAEEQRHGKGQRSSSWSSEPHKNLTFSIYQTFSEGFAFDLMEANMKVALAVHSAIATFSIPQLSIKWPNDILSGNKKIGGILIETVFRGTSCEAMIIGLGININQKVFPELFKASSMSAILNNEVSRSDVFKTLQEKIANAFDNDESKEVLLKQFNSMLFRKDIPTSFRSAGTIFTGCIRGVNPQGKLVVENQKEQFFEYGIKEIELLY